MRADLKNKGVLPESDQYETPPEIFEFIYRRFKISREQMFDMTIFNSEYTDGIDYDGLKRKKPGQILWCNCPWSETAAFDIECGKAFLQGSSVFMVIKEQSTQT